VNVSGQCGTSRRGYFTVWRRTANKRMAAKLKQIKQTLRRRMHEPLDRIGAWLQSVARGFYQYHAVPGDPSPSQE
jgi:RNA-directed DNA polymerase